MLFRHLVHVVFVMAAACLLATPLASQQNCPVPPSIQPVSHEQDIFSDQQEVDLGDALAEQFGQRIKVIDDDTLNAYLRSLGDRLVQHLPPTQMKFRFYLIELSGVNAFSIAGGRVYVSRKMVAMARTDDELAGVLAHELGHIVTHQTAMEISARLREVLGVRQVGDRADIFDKIHVLVENEMRKPSHGGSFEKEQFVADQVALYAMARAGYAPHAYVDLWDRFQQTHGKTGNWLSDFFGGTKPSERRLREILKNVSALPPGCADIPSGSRTEEFAKWQTDVVNYSGFGTKESLPGLVFKQTLARPLRPDVANLRFSPDGKYVLAQDEGGIHVLTRDPFEVLFYIPAADARDAAFTPDSQSIAFYNRLFRVESWSIVDQRRTSVHELTLLHPCIQSELSPDGNVLACVSSQLELSLVDVASGAALVSKKSFVHLTAIGSCMVLTSLAESNEVRLIAMGFSPDARYFVASARDGTHLAWDLSSKHELSLPGSIKDAIKASFAFLGPDRLVGIQLSSPAKSPILSFPSGQRLQQVSLANGIGMRAAAHGDYLLVGPMKDGPMGLFDIKNQTLPVNFKRTAADVYDGTFVTERFSGELALNVLGKTDAIAVIKLPQARLGSLGSVAVSPDFSWMAMSNRTRGAIWDVNHNVRTMELRGFHGSWFAPDETVYVDFPKFMESEREIGHLFPVSGNGAPAYKLGDTIATQYGPYLLVTKPRSGSTREVTLSPDLLCLQIFWRGLFDFRIVTALNEDIEVRDVRDNHVVWSRYFPHEAPRFSLAGGKILLQWSLAGAGREELAKFPQLKKVADKNDYLLERIDLERNSSDGAVVVKTNKGSFSVTQSATMEIGSS
jgi:WD40 repeat protein